MVKKIQKNIKEEKDHKKRKNFHKMRNIKKANYFIVNYSTNEKTKNEIIKHINLEKRNISSKNEEIINSSSYQSFNDDSENREDNSFSSINHYAINSDFQFLIDNKSAWLYYLDFLESEDEKKWLIVVEFACKYIETKKTEIDLLIELIVMIDKIRKMYEYSDKANIKMKQIKNI